MRKCVKNMIFHNASTVIGNGVEYPVNGETEIIFNITGTSTTRTLIFEGSIDNGSTYQALSCVNLTTLDIATQTQGTNELWQVEIVGLTKFRVRLAAVGSGNVTVKGKVIM